MACSASRAPSAPAASEASTSRALLIPVSSRTSIARSERRAAPEISSKDVARVSNRRRNSRDKPGRASVCRTADRTCPRPTDPAPTRRRAATAPSSSEGRRRPGLQQFLVAQGGYFASRCPSAVRLSSPLLRTTLVLKGILTLDNNRLNHLTTCPCLFDRAAGSVAPHQ